MSRQARVTVAYATVKVLDTASGKPTVCGFYRDAVLPGAADEEAVAGLVRRGYAEWVDPDPPAGSPQPAVEEKPTMDKVEDRAPTRPAKAAKAAE